MLQIEYDAQISAIEQKIKLLESFETVTNIPEDASLKSKAIPEQTAHGKESTNPLKAEVLLKSLVEEITTPIPQGKNSFLVQAKPFVEGLDKMTTLSNTNNLVQGQKFSPKTSRDDSQRYYVIYQGPHKGIHTNWGVVESFCKEGRTTSKKFRTEEAARISLAAYEDGSSSIRPKVVQKEVSSQPLTVQDFRTLWNKARTARPEDFLSERFFTTDKKSVSLYNFIEGADALLIHQAFQAGLVHNIYPSSNLQELRFFPKQMVEAIKNFRKKVLKAKDEPLYINVVSSIFDWQQEYRFYPYHFLEIGLAKTRKEIELSQPMEDSGSSLTDILHPVRIHGLRRVAVKVFEAISETNKKVNYANNNCIITSWSYNSANKEDIEELSKFGEKFMFNSIDASINTRQSFCKQAAQLFEEHYCSECNNSSKENHSTEDKTSTATVIM